MRRVFKSMTSAGSWENRHGAFGITAGMTTDVNATCCVSSAILAEQKDRIKSAVDSCGESSVLSISWEMDSTPLLTALETTEAIDALNDNAISTADCCNIGVAGSRNCMVQRGNTLNRPTSEYKVKSKHSRYQIGSCGFRRYA